jgi:hypothetical protein
MKLVGSNIFNRQGKVRNKKMGIFSSQEEGEGNPG